MQGLLSVPDPALAARVLGDVAYEHRLVAHRVRLRWGSIPAYLYSFREVVLLLSDKQPALRWDTLEHWLRTVMRDAELADHVARIRDDCNCEREKTTQIHALCHERLSQCRELAGTGRGPSSDTRANSIPRT